MNLRKFFAELKRRNVYKVAVAYAIVAWLLIQVATQVFPFFEIPNWAVRLVVLLLILGYPIALILAWAFEITPEGIKRESEVAPDESITAHTGRKLVGVTVLLAMIAAGLLAIQVLRKKPAASAESAAVAASPSAPASPAIPEKSIAVLPFENLSSDKENAYFAEGIQDEILTRLAKIGALKVNNVNSIQAFEEAVRLDPNFALAWAALSQQESFEFLLSDKTPQRREAAHRALANAVKLGPDLVETKLADGFFQYWVECDYERARTLFESVRQSYPNNHRAPYALGAICRREGHWEQSRRWFAEAIEINPQDVFQLGDAALAEIAMRDVASAGKFLARAHDLSPDNPAVAAYQALACQMSGDLAGAQTIIDRARPGIGPDTVGVFVGNAIFLRNYGPALAAMQAQLAQPEALGSLLGSFESLLGDLQRHAGDPAAAAGSYGRARAFFEEALRGQPENADLLHGLAWAEACLGEKDAAVTHLRKAIALLPASKDAWVGPTFKETLARIEAHFGDKESAISGLQDLLEISYGIPPVTPALLRIDPDWDNLRGDPRFEKLAAQPLRPTK